MSAEGDFEAELTAIQSEEDLPYNLGAPAISMVQISEGVVVGLNDGRLLLVTIGASIEAFVMSSEDGVHKSAIRHLATTPGGSRVVSCSWEKTIRVWNLAECREEIKFEGHSESVYCVAITSDESRVVSGSKDKTVRVWNLAERREEIKFEGHSESVLDVAITPDGSRVISGSRDKSVRVWNLAERREEIKFEGHTEDVICVAITPDGSRVISGSRDNTVRVWNLAERREEINFEGHTAGVSCVAISPDGSRVVSGSSDYTVRVWNIAERREEITFEGHSKSVCCVAITPDGSNVVSCSEDDWVRVWNLAEHREEYQFKGDSEGVYCLAITPDGSKVVSGGGESREIRVQHLANRSKEMKFEGHSGVVYSAVVTPDGLKAVSCSRDKTVRVWNLAERREEVKFEGHTREVISVAITPDGSKAVSFSEDRTIRVWNLAERREEIKFEGHTEDVSCVAITPDGSRVVSCSKDMTVRVWNLAERREEIKFEGHTEDVSCVAITPDGLRVVSFSDDSTVRVWNFAERREEINFEKQWRHVRRVAITPDGSRVVSCSWENTIQVLNLAERREEIKLEGHSESVYCVAITPDGSRVVSGSLDKSVRVWNLAEHREEVYFEGHTAGVSCVAISPDGSRVVSGSSDNTVRVWNIAERREEIKLEGHSKSVCCVAITPDGSRVVSSSWDNTVRVWNLPEFREVTKSGGRSDVSSSDNAKIADPKQQAATGRTATKTPSDLRFAIQKWKNGDYLPCALAKCVYPSRTFNALHICAYFNRFKLLAEYLEAGVPLISGYFGTPLTLALQRNSVKCVNAILQFFITRLEDSDKIWLEFNMITEDLPQLLKCHSSLLHTFFGSLMRTPLYPLLPDFIVPTLPLPVTLHLSSRFINISDFDENTKAPKKENKRESVLVKFLISLPRWNFTAGSEQSLKMLSAFAECQDKLVLATPYVSAIIEDKWSRCYPFTLATTLLYLLLLCAISGILFLDDTSRLFTLSFLGLNTFFVFYELAQMFATGTAYFCEVLNWVDIARGGLSTAWPVFLLCGHNAIKGEEEVKYVTLVVVVLCYLRGFTYFRSFKMTRIFVYMTLAVVKEMYSFLLILWYSVLAFGIFSAVMLEFDSMADAWTNAYSLLMGNFDNSTYGTIEWIVFTGATMTNVIIMLNLLVSILGEAYEKTQMSVRENDLHQQLNLIIEYECMMFWRRNRESWGTVLITCEAGEDASQADEWQGQILQITKNISAAVANNFAKVSNKITAMEEKMAGTEEKVVQKIEEKVTGIEEKVVRKIEERVAGMEEKMMGIEGQLQTILGLLSSRS